MKSLRRHCIYRAESQTVSIAAKLKMLCQKRAYWSLQLLNPFVSWFFTFFKQRIQNFKPFDLFWKEDHFACSLFLFKKVSKRKVHERGWGPRLHWWLKYLKTSELFTFYFFTWCLPGGAPWGCWGINIIKRRAQLEGMKSLTPKIK